MFKDVRKKTAKILFNLQRLSEDSEFINSHWFDYELSSTSDKKIEYYLDEIIKSATSLKKDLK